MSIHHSNYSQHKINSCSTQTLSIFLWFFDYYDLAIDNTMQSAVSVITSYFLNSSWKDIKFQVNPFLEYAANQPNAKIFISFKPNALMDSLIRLNINEYKFHSLNGGFFYLSDKPDHKSSQMILHKNSMHQLKSTEKSSILSCPLFKNLKLAHVSSMTNILRPFAMPCTE